MVTDISLFNKLKEAIGEERAQVLVEFIENKVETKLAEKKEVLAAKVDLGELKADLLKWIIGIYMAGFIMMTGAILGLYFK